MPDVIPKSEIYEAKRKLSELFAVLFIGYQSSLSGLANLYTVQSLLMFALYMMSRVFSCKYNLLGGIRKSYCIRVLQRNRLIGYRNRYTRGDLLWELVHVFLEAEKSHDRLPAGRRTREASSMAHSKHKSLRPKQANDVVLSPRPKA